MNLYRLYIILGWKWNPHLAETVENPYGGTDSRTKHMRQEKVDPSTLHSAALADTYSTQHGYHRHGNRHEQDQHGEANASIALETNPCHSFLFRIL